MPPRARSPRRQQLQSKQRWSGSRTPQTLGASGSGHFDLDPNQKLSLLLKVKNCAEFVSLSKSRIEQYEKEVRRTGLGDMFPLLPSGSNLPWVSFLHLCSPPYLHLFPLLPAGEDEEHNSIRPDDPGGFE